MPQAKLKIIVSTNFGANKNPLQSAEVCGKSATPPFLISRGGVLKPVDLNNFAGEWDVMILSDEEDSGLDNFGQLLEPVEILWLHHREVALKQRPNIEKRFNNIVNFQTIPFQHTPEFYGRYLNKVAALWNMNGEYDAKLAELDIALRTEQVESDIVDFLWLLAARLSNSQGGEQINTLFLEKFNIIKKWASTDQRCPSFMSLCEAVNKGDDKRAAYTKLKSALENSIAGREAV